MTRRGLFIVLEGGEGTGKSTQAGAIAARLRQHGREVVETFEPGSGDLGREIRRLLLDPSFSPSPVTEAFLYAADRAEHVRTVIRPALDAGCDVVSDRFLWSSLAYQGRGRELGTATVADLNRLAVDGCDADLVIVLDVDPVVGLGRSGADPDRIEAESIEFHEIVRRGFRDIAAAHDAVVLDAGSDRDTVAAACWEAVVDAARRHKVEL